jgi:hypothetical protein
MPSTRFSRTPPPRSFENYILTKEIGRGLSETNLDKFLPIPGSVGQPNTDDDVSSELDIGFNFSFNNVIYNKFVVSTNGWMALVDPSSPFILAQILSSTSNENWSINFDFGGRQHLLLAPWFDDLKNKYSLTSLFTSNQQDLVNKGIYPINDSYHPTENGVMYCVEKNSSLGTRLIVRWHSISLAEDNVLIFECIIYENGRIEFRYSTRSNWRVSTGGSNDNATVGIFLDGYQQMRDFATELDYSNSNRKLSLYGGAVYDASYSDTDTVLNVANYSIGLRPLNNWPGQKSFGATLVFQPPLNKRRVLPRKTLREIDSKNSLPTVARTGDKRLGSKNIIFNDNSSILYGIKKDPSTGTIIGESQVVNYPTTLPRFYGNSAIESTGRQDLFSGDFLVTGSVVKSLVQDFIESKDDSKLSAFEDHNRPENDPGSKEDNFFSTGTSPIDVGFGFSQPLRSKTQIKLSMRVDHKTTMFGASSSIYYYNSNTNRWQYPTSSFSNGFDIANHYADVYRNRLVEVDRGFNAFGFNVCSGSNSDIRRSFGYGTDDIFNQGWTRDNETIALSKTYNKSVQNNPKYEAIKDESFSIPISQPFLLEKAVIEIPFEIGPGWFNDKTQCFLPVGDLYDASYSPAALSTPFDIGGPGITLGLFNQINIGGKSRRDLIMSGTITHSFDDVTRIVYSRSPDLTSLGGDVWQIIPQGFNAYGTPTTVISGTLGSGGYYFTGSIRLKCESSISNGVLVRDTIYINQTSRLDNTTGSLEILFNNKEWSLVGKGSIENFNQDPGGNGFRSRNIVGVNNIGRGGTGFEPSGRSIFGKEYVTSQDFSKNSYPNVFYKYKDGNTLQELVDIATSASPIPEFYATSVINRQTTLSSPYLIFPNDRLILSISKSRPYFFSTEVQHPYTTGSIQHDIKLSTGSINITLYGSLISNGSEFHDPLNQELSSNAIHEVVIGETKTW